MVMKQDRQGVRTPSDVERKYNLGGMSKYSGQNDERLNSIVQSLSVLEVAMRNVEEEIEYLKTLIPEYTYPIAILDKAKLDKCRLA
jgi:hypothetical protein